MNEEDDVRPYRVVVNDEEQFSIWLCDRELPLGWRPIGPDGTKAQCLAYIEQVWRDMRPLSVRESLERTLRGEDRGRT